MGERWEERWRQRKYETDEIREERGNINSQQWVLRADW